MRYDFNKMDADSFELMVRSLNEKIFGVKCEQFGLGPDGQREFSFDGTLEDMAGVTYEGRTIGQVKYKYPTTSEDDYQWLKKEIEGELERFRKKEAEYIPDNYLFYTNVVLTPAKDTGVKDKINKFVKDNNDIIPHFYVRGYDEVCALLDNNRDVAVCYSSHILPGDVLMQFLAGYGHEENSADIWKRYVEKEFEEEQHTRMEQAGSVTEKKISIERVCVDIDVVDREEDETVKFAEKVLTLGNRVLGYRKSEENGCLDRNENFVLIGGPGQGKSTICQFIAQIYRANYLKEAECRNQYLESFLNEVKSGYPYSVSCTRVPFKIVLREYAAWISRQPVDENISVIKYMRDRIKKIEGNELSASAIRRMLGEMAWIFFFDGLDEVPESSNRQEVLKQVKFFVETELRDAGCDCMIIATTRAQGYNNDFDEKKYKHVKVEELSKEDCYKYVEKLFGVMEEQTEKREEYLAVMKEAMEDDTIIRLMRTPLQASIISILVKSGGKPPHERYSLFQQYYDTMVRREKQKGVMVTLNDNTDWLEEIHLQVAYRLQKESESNGNPSAEIDGQKLEALIQAYVDENKDDYYEDDKGLKAKVKEILVTVTHRICFLSENRDGYYSFSIRTMQEYFAGTFLVKDKSDGEALANIRVIAYSSYWRNAMLFAFGYIELQRKNIEPEIGLLCEEMNGKNNLLREEFTADNLCLFGSWLAVDILSEDIFRGKKQDKYIKIAAEAVELAEYSEFHKFCFVSGRQREKLLAYVKERYQGKKEYHRKVLALFIRLNENEKNHLEPEMFAYMEEFEEAEKIEALISILEGRGVASEYRKRAAEELAGYLETGAVKCLLPIGVLNALEQKCGQDASDGFKRNMFLQWLWNKNASSKVLRGIIKLPKIDLRNLRELVEIDGIDFGKEKKVTYGEAVQFMLLDKAFTKVELKAMEGCFINLGIEFLADFCQFLLQPSFQGYLQLKESLGNEDGYLAEKYRDLLDFYVKRRAYTGEEEFRAVYQKRISDAERLLDGKISELMREETDISVACFLKHSKQVFDNLIEFGDISGDELEKVGSDFFEVYSFAAEEQLEAMTADEELEEKTADNMMKLLVEAERRKKYVAGMYIVIVLLVSSKWKKRLFERLPDFGFTEQMLKEEMKDLREIPRIIYADLDVEQIQAIVGTIVGKLVYEMRESNYLSMIPLLICEKICLRDCISQNDLRELKRITYTNDWNRLALELLKIGMGESEEPEQDLERIFALELPKKEVFTELERIIRCCVIEKKERLWVRTYLKLRDEPFEGSEKIQSWIWRDMLEYRYSRKG